MVIIVVIVCCCDLVGIGFGGWVGGFALGLLVEVCGWYDCVACVYGVLFVVRLLSELL